MHCTLSACADADTFAAFALACARQGADLLLCHPGPQHTAGQGIPPAAANVGGQPPAHLHTPMPPGWWVWPGGEGEGPCCLVGISPREELCLGDPQGPGARAARPGKPGEPGNAEGPGGPDEQNEQGEPDEPDPKTLAHADAALAAFLGFSPTAAGGGNASGAPRPWRPARADHDLALGFLAYTYGLPRFGIRSAKPRTLPHALLRRYHAVARWNPATGALHLSVHPSAPADMAARCARLLGDSLRQVVPPALGPGLPSGLSLGLSSGLTGGLPLGLPSDLSANLPSGLPGNARPCTPLPPSLDHDAYTQGVREVLRRIRAGDTYQCNLSTRFDLLAPGLDPVALALHLWRTRPAPFCGLFRVGDRHVVSASPERFLRVHAHSGDTARVLSQPIKGTLAFGPGTAHPHWRNDLPALLASMPKERAELSMIVDLVRNDISAHCAHGSVAVARHCATFTVGRLVQMYSDVTGEMRPGSTCLDLALSAFPGGSVTGCPKRRTLEIIESLEPHSREVYCGSLLAVADARNMDASIAIRTGWHDKTAGRFAHCAGSGIVVDSDPESEYEETWAKAANFREACA